MTWSLGEIEAETRKAVRGAGLPWGIAEEAGKALRWLAARGCDGLPALAGLLEAHDRGAVAAQVAVDPDGRWHGGDKPLCPLCLGASLADHAGRLPIAAGAVLAPLLLVPFAARAAQGGGQALALSLSCPAGTVLVGASGEPAGTIGALAVDAVANMRCERAAPAPSAPAPSATAPVSPGRCPIDPAGWARIAAFAHRTYVPASEASRQRGAGAGLIDND